MITPSYLRPNDTIGIVATGRRVSPDDIEQSLEIIKRWGVQLKLSPHIYSTQHSYLAGVDDERLPDLQAMLDDPTIKAIVCARGGYGTVRILDQIDFNGFRKNPKWIAGFSDITALHQSLFVRGFQSIHGSMPIQFPRDTTGQSVESLRQALFGEIAQPIVATANAANRPGVATGRVVGGNLSLLASVMGTADAPDTTGAILVIEEIGEYWYKIDRMIVQLMRAGKFDKLAGLVLGYFTDMTDDAAISFGEKVERIIHNHTKQFNFPIGFNFPTGHENPNIAWKHGSVMELRVTAQGSWLTPVNEPVKGS